MSPGPSAGGEAGFVLPELLITMVISVIVLGSVLATFVVFDTTSTRDQAQAEAHDRTRAATDQLARDLRNLASPTAEQPQAVDLASAYDLVFETVDTQGPPTPGNQGNVRRVRYCLPPGGAAGSTLWMQSQTWTTAVAPPIPSTAYCPDPSWGNQRTLVSTVTNRAAGQDRPLFQFNASTPTAVSAVVVQLWTSAGKGVEPAQGLLRTQVFLRNQNRAPQADFDARATGLLHLLLNASGSADPEGEELTYRWYDGSTFVGAGILFDLRVATPGTHTIRLEVFDPAGLKGQASRTVTVL